LDTDKTVVYDSDVVSNAVVKDILKDVFNALQDRGYNPIVQISGYLLSGDIGYISNHMQARSKIKNLEREQILEVLLKDFLQDKWNV